MLMLVEVSWNEEKLYQNLKSISSKDVLLNFYNDTYWVRTVEWTSDFLFNRPRTVELIDIVSLRYFYKSVE